MSGRHPARLQKADTRADPVIKDAMDSGYMDSGAVYTIPGFPTHEAANQARLSVNRSARRQNLSTGAWVTGPDQNQCLADCQHPGEPHEVHFRLWSKDAARTHVFKESGGDPANLKWNPWTSHRSPRYSDTGAPE